MLIRTSTKRQLTDEEIIERYKKTVEQKALAMDMHRYKHASLFAFYNAGGDNAEMVDKWLTERGEQSIAEVFGK